MGKPILNIPKWKKYLSYFKDVPLEFRESNINTHLNLSLVKGRFQLCTDNAIYSFDDLYENFTAAFEKLNFGKLPNKEVLILGLGLGSIPYMLEHKFNQNLFFTGVEIDEEVVDLLNAYTLPRLTSPMDIIMGDAQTFVRTTQEKFGLICIDVFIDEKIPEVFKTQSFLEELREVLSPDGVILFNHLGITKEDRENTERYFEEIFKSVFPNPYLLHIKGNYILFNDKNAIS